MDHCSRTRCRQHMALAFAAHLGAKRQFRESIRQLDDNGVRLALTEWLGRTWPASKCRKQGSWLPKNPWAFELTTRQSSLTIFVPEP